MPKSFEKVGEDVLEMASAILVEYESHKPLLDSRVRIDILFAVPAIDDKTGEYVGDAIKHRGVKASGQARIIGLKDRAAGRGDAEVLIDKEWWEKATRKQQLALLDHELHHFAVKENASGTAVRDDLNRPKLVLREHDLDVGWFAIIAERHGEDSAERMQAHELFLKFKREFWPQLESQLP